MLYTLVGNGKANETEIIATLLSLRDAVGAKDPTDEFWMAFQDIGIPGDTVHAVINFLNDSMISYEVVVPAEREPSPEYAKADTHHTARRPLDMLLKLTKGRLQPGEESAILILSDDLDTDNVALYAIERAIAEGIPVYDLGGQMTPIVLEENPQPQVEVEAPVDDVAEDWQQALGEKPPLPLPDTQMHEAAVVANEEPVVITGVIEVGESITIAVPETQVIADGTEITVIDAETGEELSATLQPSPEVEQLTLFDPSEYEVGEMPLPQDLSYTRADLESLTRDELKALVKQQEVIPTDMRSKESMIEALMAKVDGPSPQTWVGHAGQPVEPDIEGKDLDPGYMHRTPEEQREVNRQSIERGIDQAVAGEVVDLGSFQDEVIGPPMYILRIGFGGEHASLQYVPREKVPLINTILEDPE